MLLKRNWDSSLNSTNHLGVAFSVLRLLLLEEIAFLLFLIRDEYFFDSCFISNGVDVQDALVTLGKNRLVRKKFKNVNLSFEKVSDGKLIFHSTEDISLVHKFLIVYIQ